VKPDKNNKTYCENVECLKSTLFVTASRKWTGSHSTEGFVFERYLVFKLKHYIEKKLAQN